MKKLICIVCPVGCHLEVDEQNNYAVTGNTCPKGEIYGREELTAPKRMVTSTVKIKNSLHERVPVKTSVAIPKEKVFECMKLLNDIEISSPVKIGDKVLENIFGLGTDIIITRNM
ncbi:MAG: DUF1667 domain-containing protein [Fusobacteriaceae bacterium]